MEKKELMQLVEQYHPVNDHEIACKKQVMEFIDHNDVFLGKGNLDGHITGSAWIVNANRGKVLLTHHRKLDKWLQLGGHTDEDEDVLSAAVREAQEESSLTSLRVVSGEIFDIDVHRFPARENVKAHFHFDLRFLLEGDEKEKIQVSNESKDIRWISLKEIDIFTQEESIKRMARKTRGLL